ncbi:MAG TPA: hypothetical protein V6D50_23335 [Chroococcales cyanobacterium]|jgi:hypothetical protein
MKTTHPKLELKGETTDVNEWLSRSGLRFEDLGDDPTSVAIRRQWREYQAAVRMFCITTQQTPERVQLSGVYEKLRVPQQYSLTSVQ